MTEPARQRSATVPGVLLASGLVALSLLRVAGALAPSGMAWGVGAARDLNPVLGVALLALGLAGAGLGVARLEPLAALPIADAPRRAWPFALAGVLTLLLVVFPDRVRFVGDFVLRLGILESANGFEHIFPQALELDRLLNHALPVRAGALLGVEPLVVLRTMGVLELWLLVGLATRFGRLVSPRESVAAVVAIAIACGGYATLLSGYSKPTPQLALCALAATTLGTEQVRRGSARVPFALAVAAGLALHRGGLPLLLPWAVASALTLRRFGLGAGRARVVNAVALALPLVVLALEARALTAVITTFDTPVNFLPREVQAQGGPLAAAFTPLRLLDDANAMLMHAPLAPLVVLTGFGDWRRAERLLVLAAVLAFLPLVLFVHLPLGPFRDWDALGGEGAVLAVASAWAVADVLARAHRGPGLAPAAAMGAAVPFLTLLLSLTDLPHGFARAERIAAGPPPRSAAQRASLLDWIGLRALNEEQFGRAREAYRRLCLETPIPHALKLWGAAALIDERPAEAQQAFTRLLEGSVDDPVGWYGLWMSAVASGDTLAARRASEHASRWPTDSKQMADVVEFFDHYPRLYAVLRRTLER